MKHTLVALVLVSACGGDDSEADRLGIGAQCDIDDDCLIEDDQVCLTAFAGGYCGRADCATDLDCPEHSACIAGADTNYCFRTCIDKADCNANRDVEVEANCSANVTFLDGTQGRKACVPPSSGL